MRADHHPRLIAMSTHSRLGVLTGLCSAASWKIWSEIEENTSVLVGPKEE